LPQLHIRRVYQYQDDDDVWRIGQTKAPELAGVPYDVEAATQERLKTALSKKRREAVKAREDEEGRRLKPREAADVRKSVRLSKEETSAIRNNPQPTRHANRLMTFDKMVRGWWCDICEEHGIEVERTPLPPHKSRSKEKMLWEREKEVRTKEEQIERARQDYEQLLSLNAQNAQRLRESDEELQRLDDKTDEAYRDLRHLNAAVREARDVEQRLNAAVAAKHDELEDLEYAADEARKDSTAHDLLRGFAGFIDRMFPGLKQSGYDPVAFVDNFLQERQRSATNRRRVLSVEQDVSQDGYDGPSF
jgi:DNA repair exonuclease SbcCD ATPase subunit